MLNYISLGSDFDYVQFIIVKGIKYYNKDYTGEIDDKIILRKLEE